MVDVVGRAYADPVPSATPLPPLRHLVRARDPAAPRSAAPRPPDHLAAAQLDPHALAPVVDASDRARESHAVVQPGRHLLADPDGPAHDTILLRPPVDRQEGLQVGTRVRVEGRVPEPVWRKRYAAIRDFEANLIANGVIVLKFFLNVSKKEQRKRFLERIEEPQKHWKFSVADLAERDFRSLSQGELRKTLIARALIRKPEALLLDEGLPFPSVEAAMAAPVPDLPALAARARAFTALAGQAAFEDAVIAYNRCAALAAKDPAAGDRVVDPALFTDQAERELADALEAARGPLLASLDHLDLEAAVTAAAGLRSFVDRYFDAVLVMDPDDAVRANRLAQLAAVTGLIGRIGEFSRLPLGQS